MSLEYIVRSANCRCHAPRVMPREVLGLKISASVGDHGAYVPADTRIIQAALNQLVPEAGGANPELAVDGICGPKTIKAIRVFQAMHFAPAQVDGRIDPENYSIRKLRELLNSSAKKGSGGGGKSKPLPVTPDDQVAAHMFLYLSQWRIRLAIVALDYAVMELDEHGGKGKEKPSKAWGAHLKMVDRCFHVLGAHSDVASIRATIRRIRRVFASMYEVIANTLVTTPQDELTGRRRYIVVEPANVINARWPQYPKGVLADAAKGGWALRNGKAGRISLNRDTLYRPDAVITVIHEMAHFVSSQDTYFIEDHAYYQASLKLDHYLAVRTAACYEYMVFFATFPYYVDFDDKILQEPW